MSIMSASTLGTGWQRPDGRIGLRNHVVALSTVALTDRLTQLASQQVPGTLALTAGLTRGVRGADARLQQHVIKEIALHPNAGAVLVIAHDKMAASRLEASLAGLGKPYLVMALMSCDGYQAAIDSAILALRVLTREAEHLPKVPVGLGDLCVALECGGSDASSAICANPGIGRFVDALVAAGGTAIVSETAEFIGAESVIRRQSATPEVAQQILACLAREEAMMNDDGDDYRGVNPTAENIDAGLTTLIEKSMGAVCKIGNSPIVGCLDFAERPTRPGLHFMDTPFFSPVSMTGMVCAGSQVTLFAMGVFNPSGCPLAPTVKICGNPQTMRTWGADIDVDVSGMINATQTLDQAAERIAAAVARCARGELTHTEARGEGQIMVPRTLSAL